MENHMEKDIEFGELPQEENDTETGIREDDSLATSLMSPHQQNSSSTTGQFFDDTDKMATYDAVTHLIVPVDKNNFFKKWLVESYDEVSLFQGFISRRVHEIEVRDDYIEYVMINIFQSYNSFKEWFSSSERMKLMKQLKNHRIQWTVMNAYGGSVEADAQPSTPSSQHPMNRINLQNSLVKIPKPLPPPKWKLTIILIASIYIIVVSYVFSQQSEFYFENGLPKSFIYFIFVAQLVLINVYALAPLVMEIPFIDHWLREKRPDPDSMHPLHAVLDQGFKIFAVKISPPPHPELVRRLDTLERKLERLREMEYNLKLSIQKTPAAPTYQMHEDNPTSPIHSLRSIESSIEKITTRKRSNSDKKLHNRHHHKITMAVRHYVKWECLPEFEDWNNKMEAEMNKWPGFLGCVRIYPQNYKDPFINSFSFDTPEHLLAFSKSPERLRLLNELPPLLEGTSATEINQERMFRDAFSELLVATGGSIKSRPPPLWKTAFLSIISLHLIVWFVGGNLQEYFIEANLGRYLISFIKLTIHITINSYLGVPLMFSQFGEWVHMDRPIKQIGIIHYLDQGLPNRWIRLGVVIGYMFLNIFFGILRAL